MGIQDGCRCEHGHFVDGHYKGTDIFLTNVADLRGSGVRNNTRDKAPFPNVGYFDLETKAGVFTRNGRR